ncbi:phage regulatory CII family protein [Vibrio owensii]|uniref:hypothetical protein n=1 Tax=Vibrio owensii TaxID=696485 RepID=UPI002894B107|nr:hypothetical protein THZB04_10280 [Vibrio owensii]
MDVSNSMYVLPERKQQASDAVCCDFVVNHDAEAIGRKLALNGTMIRKMLNPKQSPVLKLICSSQTGHFIKRHFAVQSSLG